MGYSPLLRGRVQGLARGINVPNAVPDASGLASVNPIFTFVRLAQRVPVRIRIDEVPDGVKLVAGLTATVQIEPYQAPAALAPAPAPAPGKMSRAAPDASATLVADEATLQPAPGQTMSPAAANGAPSQADRRAAQPRAAAQTPSPQSATGPAAPVRGLGELAVSAPPSPEASNAAAAASADLKTLEEQIAANPPSGPASPPGGANRGSGASADLMAPSEYLGQTFDLEGDQSATPEPRRRSPDSLRRRARSRWRRINDRQ